MHRRASLRFGPRVDSRQWHVLQHEWHLDDRWPTPGQGDVDTIDPLRRLFEGQLESPASSLTPSKTIPSGGPPEPLKQFAVRIPHLELGYVDLRAHRAAG